MCLAQWDSDFTSRSAGLHILVIIWACPLGVGLFTRLVRTPARPGELRVLILTSSLHTFLIDYR